MRRAGLGTGVQVAPDSQPAFPCLPFSSTSPGDGGHSEEVGSRVRQPTVRGWEADSGSPAPERTGLPLGRNCRPCTSDSRGRDRPHFPGEDTAARELRWPACSPKCFHRPSGRGSRAGGCSPSRANFVSPKVAAEPSCAKKRVEEETGCLAFCPGGLW